MADVNFRYIWYVLGMNCVCTEIPYKLCGESVQVFVSK